MIHYTISSGKKVRFVGITILFFVFFQGVNLAVSYDQSYGDTIEWVNSSSENSSSLKVVQSLSIPKVVNSSVIIDGEIDFDEYLTSFIDPITSIIVFWEHNSINLTVGLISPLTGWVSFGIVDVENVSRHNDMHESNMIIGGVSSGSTYTADLYGITGYVHGNDTENGGFDNILEASATENTSHTIFEFTIPLNSTDSLDPPMAENTTISIFVGNSANDLIVGGSHISPGGHSATIDVFLRPTAIETRGTSLTLQVSSEIHQGDKLSLDANLKDELENPLENRTIIFFLDTKFGILEISQVDTNISGDANTSFIHPTLSGNLSFGVKFIEDSDESGS
ncbi:MAG: DOMON domain-containing protein, partial [Candidatus Kariarchaeaceae archaeon]